MKFYILLGTVLYLLFKGAVVVPEKTRAASAALMDEVGQSLSKFNQTISENE